MKLDVQALDLKSVVEWSEALSTFRMAPDVYFRPGYHSACEANGDGHSTALVVRSGDECLLVPYLRCPIPGCTAEVDVQSAYGYGGPLFQSRASGFCAAAWSAVARVWKDQGVVAAFLRLHPILDNARWLGPGWQIVDDRPTVSIDLRYGVSEAFAGSAGANHRNMVRRAAQLGMSAACIQATALNLERFVTMYWDTMTRLRALPERYFTVEYFATLAAELGDDLQIVEVVDVAGRAVCTALIMYGPHWAHYHLSARIPDTVGCATNLLLQCAAESAARRGLSAVHLGGGRTSDPLDSLYMFKGRVGQARHLYRTARLVVDQARYASLLGKWRLHHPGATPTWFLAYRQP